MTLVVDNKKELDGQPGVHALIVGVSAYPDLPEPGQRLEGRHYGMWRLTSAARSAYDFYRWVVASNDRLPVPLATCRLLLSPSAPESEAEPGLEGLAEKATVDAFLAEALAWRADASKGGENMTLFYFAGHGVHRDKENAVLLLEGFGDGVGGPLRHGVDLANIRAGMAPTANLTTIARKQFYFVDACRVLPSKFRDFTQLYPTQVFAPELSGIDDRADPILYASASGTVTYGIRGKGSLFSKALIECLEGDAGDLQVIDDEEVWVVTLHRLTQALKMKYEKNEDELNETVFLDPSGTSPDTVLCRLRERPSAEIVFTVDPEGEVAVTRISARDGDPAAPKVMIPHPLDPHPHSVRVPAGFYTINAEIHPADPGRTAKVPGGGQPRPVLPPRVVKRIMVKPVKEGL